MPARPFILASASPARLRLLGNIGIQPEVVVSGVDEAATFEESPANLALALACAKARTVAGRLEATATPGTLVLGCDSVFEFGGSALGKPVDADDARRRWRAMRGQKGTLHTGHCLVIIPGRGEAAPTEVAEVASTIVRFATPCDEEIDDYVAGGEPLVVAGGFTLDGWSAPFVDSVVGDPSNVIGLSLPLLRRLLLSVGVSLADVRESTR